MKRLIVMAPFLISTLVLADVVAGQTGPTPTGPEASPEVSERAARSGFHFSIGVGAASVSATCPGCGVDFVEDRLSGFSGLLQIGAVATERLVIAAEFTGWIKNDVPVYRRIAGLSVILQGYPSETSGFFVKAGLGGVRAIAEDDVLLVQTDAFMSTTGIGYDVPVGDRTNVTAFLNYVRSFGGETWINGVVSPVVFTPNAFQVGASFTVH